MNNQTINHNLPTEYKQYPTIIFCSNKFVNLKYFIDDNGFVPLLVGFGEIPRIWLYSKQENNPIVIVKDSISNFPFVKVNIFNKTKKIVVEATKTPELETIKIIEIDFSDEIPIVSYIDLSPIGYRVNGNKDELNIGDQTISNTLFENLKSLITIENNH